jgi:hypothetical protein
MSFGNDDDITMTSSSSNEKAHMNHSTHPPEGKTIAVAAVMRGKPKDGYHHHHSNKHYKQTLVQVLFEVDLMVT